MQCTSEYPCPPEQAGINVLSDLRSRYKDIAVGYSDHTMCVAIAIAAVINGATVLEKHFTLSQKMYGSDALNSTEPDEFKKLVDEIRILESALSSKIDKDEKAKALRNMKITFEKSIVSSGPMSKLDILEFKDMTFKKPGDGIPAKDYRMLIGKKLKQSINKNHKFKWIDFE